MDAPRGGLTATAGFAQPIPQVHHASDLTEMEAYHAHSYPTRPALRPYPKRIGGGLDASRGGFTAGTGFPRGPEDALFGNRFWMRPLGPGCVLPGRDASSLCLSSV